MSDFPDGVYLNMSFEDYLAAPRVSSGDLSNMIESPSAYWANSHMNPDREPREESDSMKLGRAYHCARLEPELFDDLYVEEFTADDMPEGSLLSDRDMKEWLKNFGLPQTKAGETVLERARRIEDNGGPQTFHLTRADWENEHDGLTWLTAKQMAEVRRDAERIRMNPELAALISNGLAEVSIFWTDEDTGLRCKCRPDYLGPGWITHLKTWDSKVAGKPGNRAVVDAFRFNGYYRTGWFYHEGLASIREQGLKVQDGDAGQFILDCETWETWFLFVRRSGIPDIRAREVMYFGLPRGVEAQSIGAEKMDFARGITALGRKASLEVRECLRQINECAEIYGRDGSPWFPRDMMGRIEDDDFSDFWLDSLEQPR